MQVAIGGGGLASAHLEPDGWLFYLSRYLALFLSLPLSHIFSLTHAYTQVAIGGGGVASANLEPDGREKAGE